jgi:SAM-dependent methyltransferase
VSALDLDRLGDYYDERYEGDYMDRHGGLEPLRVHDTLASVALPPEPAVVDYGCGRGAWIPVLQDAFPGARLIGVEISPRAVQRARRDHPGAEFHEFDGTTAPLPDASADLVFSYHVLEHVLDLDATVADMARIVRPGGYVVAIMPCANPGSVENLTARLLDRPFERSSTGERRLFYEDPGHLRRLSSHELAAPFARHGCEPAGGLYARRLAALAYLAASPPLVRSEFDPRRGRTPAARAVLAALRGALFAVAALTRANREGPGRLRRMLAEDERPAWRLAALGGLAAYPLAAVVGRGVEHALPRWEWSRSSTVAHGASGQFLVFRRTPS